MKQTQAIYDHKKYLTLVLVILMSCIVGGLYGILHDQLTYTVSNEYYTKFKFYQFGLMDVGEEALFPNPRLQVAIVGFMATWWMGLPIGLILGLVGLVHSDSRQMLKFSTKAMLITVLVALITGLVGLGIGKFIFSESGASWRLPENLVDKSNFIAVGSMHNFSYLGGLIGLIAGSMYSFKHRRQHKGTEATERLTGT